MVLGLVLLLSVVWLLWPSLVGTPGIDDPMAAGHAWDYASDAVKPMRLVLTLHWLVSLGRKLLREAMQQGRALRKRRRVLPPEGPGGTTNTTTTTTSAALGAESSTAPSTPRFQRLSAESPPALAEHSMSGLQRVRTAEAASAMPRLSTADLEEEHSSYSMREECHVAFIQVRILSVPSESFRVLPSPFDERATWRVSRASSARSCCTVDCRHARASSSGSSTACSSRRRAS